MDKNDIHLLVMLTLFAITVITFVWLIKRASQENRIYWFVGCSAITIFLLGIYGGPLAMILTISILALIKNEENNPLKDILAGTGGILSLGFVLTIHALYLLIAVGGLYWIWLSIKLESFSMFAVGLFPLSWLVTGPGGVYSLMIETPNWVITTFS
jgi:hypothetical protein